MKSLGDSALYETLCAVTRRGTHGKQLKPWGAWCVRRASACASHTAMVPRRGSLQVLHRALQVDSQHVVSVRLRANVRAQTQVGLLAMQMPDVGLDILGAESEGQIGCAACNAGTGGVSLCTIRPCWQLLLHAAPCMRPAQVVGFMAGLAQGVRMLVACTR